MNRLHYVAKSRLNIDHIDDAEIGEVKVVKTWYSPNGYPFNEKDEYVDYMLNEFPFVLSVTAFLAIRDNTDYMPYEEYIRYLQTDEKIQADYKEFIRDMGYEDQKDYTLKDFLDDDAFTDYIAENNEKLADDLEVGLTGTTGWHKNGPEYYLEGTWTALHTFCEKACAADGEPGEALYKYKQALDKLKKRILSFEGSQVKESGHARIVEDSKDEFSGNANDTLFTVFRRDSGDGNLACQYYFGTSLKAAKAIFESMCKEGNDLQFSEETYQLELWEISTPPEIITPKVKEDIYKIDKIEMCTEQNTNALKSRDAEQALDELSAQGLAVQLDTYHY